MADEIAQVCQYEIEGMRFVVKGTVEAARLAFTFMKWLCSDRYEKGFVMHGEKGFKTILKMSQPDGPGCVMVDKEVADQVAKMAKKQGLHFHRSADFNPNCSERAFFVPPKELAILTAIYKEAAAKELKESKEKISEYDGKIEEVEKQLLDAQNLVAKLMTQLENMKQAKVEVEKQSRTYEEIVNSDDLSCNFQEFLTTLKGSEFEKDPDKAFTAMCNGIDNPPEFVAKECLQPVRDPSKAPKAGVHYYLPEIGAVVTRKFEIDKETGLVYSNYYIKNKDGELYNFTDKDKTNEEWNRSILPELYDKAGIFEETKCKVFDSPERMKVYYKMFGSTIAQSEINVKNKIEKGEKVFSSAEAEQQIKYAVDQYVKGKVSAKMDREEVTMWIDRNAVLPMKGKVVYDLGNDKYMEIPTSAVIAREENDNLIEIKITKDAEISIVEKAEEVKLYNFTTAINLDAVAEKADGHYVIANHENPNFMIAVNTSKTDIEMQVLNNQGELQETVSVPVVKDKNSHGYEAIKSVQAKYGFSDQIAVFDSVSAVREEKDNENRNGGFKVLETLSAETVANRINATSKGDTKGVSNDTSKNVARGR